MLIYVFCIPTLGVGFLIGWLLRTNVLSQQAGLGSTAAIGLSTVVWFIAVITLDIQLKGQRDCLAEYFLNRSIAQQQERDPSWLPPESPDISLDNHRVAACTALFLSVGLYRGIKRRKQPTKDRHNQDCPKDGNDYSSNSHRDKAKETGQQEALRLKERAERICQYCGTVIKYRWCAASAVMAGVSCLVLWLIMMLLTGGRGQPTCTDILGINGKWFLGCSSIIGITIGIVFGRPRHCPKCRTVVRGVHN